eukprot:544850_1
MTLCIYFNHRETFLTFWIHLIRLFRPIYNQTKTSIMNTKTINILVKYANIEILLITNHKPITWIHINDLNYISNNMKKFGISPEKHWQDKQLIYHLLLRHNRIIFALFETMSIAIICTIEGIGFVQFIDDI